MKKIKDEYPTLVKYEMYQMDDDFKVPEEMIELIKEWFPFHYCIGLKWGKYSSDEEREQTQMVSDKCDLLRKKILAFDFFGRITLIVNSVPLILEIFWDEEAKEKCIQWHDTKVVSFNFEWTTND